MTKYPFLRNYWKSIVVSIHNRNLRVLAIEMHKIYHGISPTIMNEIITLRPKLAITCSKLTTETLKQGVKYVQS